MGEIASGLQNNFLAIFWTSIAIYIVKFVKFTFSAQKSPCLAIVFLIGCTILETAAYIVMMVYYCLSLYSYNLIDIELLNYARDN